MPNLIKLSIIIVILTLSGLQSQGDLDDESNVESSILATEKYQKQKLRECINTISLLSCNYCGLSSRNKIVGGRSANPHEYPWMAALAYDGEVICGASLITDMHLLTAAHCLISITGKKINKLRIYLRLHDKTRLGDGIMRQVSKVILHPDYNTYTSENDIALIEMVRKISFSMEVHPVCLPCQDLNVTGSNVTVTGWGSIKESGNTSNILQKVVLPVIDRQVCYKALSNFAYVVFVPSMICAGIAEGGKDSCQGDSGGPMTWRFNGVSHLVGIVSWGEGCARANSYGVYTRVASFLNWINTTTSSRNC